MKDNELVHHIKLNYQKRHSCQMKYFLTKKRITGSVFRRSEIYLWQDRAERARITRWHKNGLLHIFVTFNPVFLFTGNFYKFCITFHKFYPTNPPLHQPTWEEKETNDMKNNTSACTWHCLSEHLFFLGFLEERSEASATGAGSFVDILRHAPRRSPFSLVLRSVLT